VSRSLAPNAPGADSGADWDSKHSQREVVLRYLLPVLAAPEQQCPADIKARYLLRLRRFADGRLAADCASHSTDSWRLHLRSTLVATVWPQSGRSYT
jgi:hypothetical protein